MMEVVVTSAKKREAGILRHLMQYYLHDFSEFADLQMDETGRFTYPYLDQYWDDPDRYPFLIRVDGELAGFALLRFEVDPSTGRGQMDLAEFFILRRFRRQRAGTGAARRLWDLFPGPWQVRVLTANKSALGFWKKVIGDYTENRYGENQDSKLELNFHFSSGDGGDSPEMPEMDLFDY